jgi:hypothetical protein
MAEMERMGQSMIHYLKFPDMRSSLIWTCFDLSDLAFQKKEWVNPNSETAFWFEFALTIDEFEIYDFFKDEDNSCIGYVLRSIDEEILIKKVASLSIQIIKNIGQKKSSSDYLNSVFWGQIVETAKKTFETCKYNDEYCDVFPLYPYTHAKKKFNKKHTEGLHRSLRKIITPLCKIEEYQRIMKDEPQVSLAYFLNTCLDQLKDYLRLIDEQESKNNLCYIVLKSIRTKNIFKKFADVIEETLAVNGKNEIDSRYLESSQWKNIVAEAKETLTIL